MKKLSYLIISSVIASPLAFAASWEYDPVDTSANTKEELKLQFVNYSIDTTGGVLTVTGNMQNYGNGSSISITGANNLVVGGKMETIYGRTTLDNANLNVTGDINTMYAPGEIFVTGTSSQNGSGKWIFQSGGKLTLDENATLNAGNRLEMHFTASVNMGANSTLNVSAFQALYEKETGFSFTMGDGAKINASGQTIKVKNFTLGNNNTINANLNILNTFEVGQSTTINGNLQATDLIINKGAAISGNISYTNSLTVNSGASVKIADYFHQKNTITLNNAGTKAISTGVDYWFDADSTLNIHLGNNSLAAVNDRFKALVFTLYGKAGEGQTGEGAKINVYLSDFVLGEDFVDGEQYKIALICSQHANISGWESIFNLVDDSAVADFVEGSLVHENNTWWVTVQGVSIPEPSTYAAIFGALAIAFAAYRRHKR
ncbi:PEP-CTERM sorting domain-containing protein [Intestinicryptomonas porci]|uniref:PEP-CTERM sorting domain-containing protein n=1 Tax=Intestinicryptomonas porci TaxID=2926320 RepID=A0ABU4WGR9_9BACT|nr:PEP-CTERM sorting domain-containing protein [Opitutales bacterium CLA-KB-P66]